MCNLLGMSVQLTRTSDGEGGFCIIPGSHKANVPIPRSIPKNNEALSKILIQPVLEPGDVVLFSEATMHGALHWKGQKERRIALYRFGPSNMAYGRGYLQKWSTNFLNSITKEQRAVIEPPYGNRLDREVLVNDNEVLTAKKEYPRDDKKKAFDRQLFGRDYF